MTRPLIMLTGCAAILTGCCSTCSEPSQCVPSGPIEVAPDGSIISVTGPATLEDAHTGERTTVPAGETWRSTPNGWEVVR